MTEPSSFQLQGGKKPILVILGVGLAVMLVTSFFYRLDNPSMVKEMRQAPAGPPSGMPEGMGSMGGNRIRSLMAAMQENPDDPGIQLELGEAFMIMRAWPRAMIFLDRALELEPKNVRALRGKGMVLFEMEKPGEAAEVFETILKIDPSDPQVHYNLGIIKRYYLEKPEEGLAHFQTVVDLEPEDAELEQHARKELEKDSE